MSDSKGAAIRQKLEKLEVPKMVVWIDKELKVETTNLTEKTVDEILALLAQEVKQTQTNAVAWTIGVIDNMHYNSEPALDSTYKGLKNTIRDRYLAETGVDPAPSYPIKAGLV